MKDDSPKKYQKNSEFLSSHNGFSLIETLVAIGVLGIFFAAISFILHQVLINIGESRVRTTALSLAQTKMETVRNLPYNQVGTDGGIPNGPLLQTENVTINGLVFVVNTSIVFVDDPFDGEVPIDLINTDYKRVRVEITWGGVFPSRKPITLVTNIAPKGIESISGGGTLFIQVLNAEGQPVSNSTVTIDNTQVTPAIHIQTLTDGNGHIVLPGSPACVSCYQISITKNGYSTDKTYTISEVANPLQPLATIIDGKTTQLSFTIDAVSSAIIRSVGPGPTYGTITNVLFTLRGSKIIGHDTQDEPVYKYSFSTNTGGGSVNIPNLEWDNYTLDLTNSSHNLAGSNPIQPFPLTAGLTNYLVTFVAVPKTNNSLLLKVTNDAGELQASASAQLKSIPLNFEGTLQTSATGSADFGQVFFGGLALGDYDLKVNLPGYEETSTSINVTGIKQENVVLNTVQ